MKLQVYLSGPVTGRPELATRLAFDKYEKAVLAMNMTPINPLKLGCKGEDWNKDMKVCLHALLDCNLIIMLPDWQNSEGARLENTVAKSLSINELKLKV
jgi:hypothetical protein